MTPKPSAHEAFLTKQDIDAWLEGRKGVARQGRRRLLLVDDDEGTRILLTKMLEKDYDVKAIKAELPIIIITGHSTEKSAIDAVNLRVAGYLTKPFRDNQVLEAAARAIGAPVA